MKRGCWTYVAAGVVILAATALLGPRARLRPSPEALTMPDLPTTPRDLDSYLADEEARVPGIRPGAEKAIVWADSTAPARTALAVVYLHGFSADRHEIDPVPRMLADSLGANLFYTRLTGHGRDGAAMGEATGEAWIRDVVEAMAVGNRLGARVVLMGTSTGGTLATWVAARPELRGSFAAVVLISPNYALRDGRARMLLWPWGGLLARAVAGRERCFEARNLEQARHWTTCYPTKALMPMMALVDMVRSMDVGAVTAPVLAVYSTEDEVVDERETARMIARFGSHAKHTLVIRGGEDPEHHVVTGDIMSPSTTDTVVAAALAFVRSVTDSTDAAPGGTSNEGGIR
ncbi:MAG: alpha/beta hydrolase [Gemmatimonadetes bacterium]|nr:alpha/beta hydrolase [Gemmatimonadota bacterium]